MKRLGFTLMELVVSISILVILAGILAPVFADAKKSGLETSTKVRLHQFHAALSLYQQDWGEGMAYGPPASMGLPLYHNVFETKLYLPVEFWQSPCGNHPSQPPILMNYGYFPGDGGDHWDNVVGIYRENMILMFDMNCSNPAADLDNMFMTHKGIGVMLGGQIVVRNKRGSYYDAAWWGDPSP